MLGLKKVVIKCDHFDYKNTLRTVRLRRELIGELKTEFRDDIYNGELVLLSLDVVMDKYEVWFDVGYSFRGKVFTTVAAILDYEE